MGIQSPKRAKSGNRPSVKKESLSNPYAFDWERGPDRRNERRRPSFSRVFVFPLFSSRRGPRADPRSRFFSPLNPRQERLHSLEHALASERVPKRSDKSGGAGGSGGSDKSNAFVRSGGGSGGDATGRFADGPRDFVPASGLGVPGKESDEGLPSRSPATNLFQSGLFVETRPRDAKRGSSGASDKSGSGGSGKSPQSPSPLHRAPPDPSRSRSQSDERETLARRWRSPTGARPARSFRNLCPTKAPSSPAWAAASLRGSAASKTRA
jgi:hypothetical protein